MITKPISVLTLLGMTAIVQANDPVFECPDSNALELLDRVSNAQTQKYGHSDTADAYSYVIKHATRQMDDVALHRACFRLAYDTYFAEHYSPGSDVFGRILFEESVRPLREKLPILSRCPDEFLYETQLPIRRPLYEPPPDAVRESITGWVDLELDIADDGRVLVAQIVSSSNEKLEEGVVDHVMKFRYPSTSHLGVTPMRREAFQLRIRTDYHAISRAKGCEFDYP